MPDKFPIGSRIRHFRERSSLTRAAVARACDITANDIERVESGETDPSLGMLSKIAEAVGCPIPEFFALSPTPIECAVRLLPAETAPESPSRDFLPVPLVSGEVAGGNARIVDEKILGWLFLPKEPFGRRAGNLVAVQVFGRSMEPEIPDGALVAVDRNDRVLAPRGIYALRDKDGGCTVKRVQVLDPSHVALIPSNRAEFEVEFWKLEPGELIEDRLIGRVVWLGYNLMDADKAAESRPPWGSGDGRPEEEEPF